MLLQNTNVATANFHLGPSGTQWTIDRQGVRQVSDGQWKYIHYLELDGMDELYDLKTDPYETR
ncbi:MAG: hypothetical protein IPJ07_08200 [Acidobacteria bacterium]|nr:hypothetical protein [Acidobacteriota bacterium]